MCTWGCPVSRCVREWSFLLFLKHWQVFDNICISDTDQVSWVKVLALFCTQGKTKSSCCIFITAQAPPPAWLPASAPCPLLKEAARREGRYLGAAMAWGFSKYNQPTNPTQTAPSHLTPNSLGDFLPQGYSDHSFSCDLIGRRQRCLIGCAGSGLQVAGGMEWPSPSVCPERQRQGHGALAAAASLLSPSYCLLALCFRDWRVGTFSPTTDLLEGGRGWRLNQPPMANDIINHS